MCIPICACALGYIYIYIYIYCVCVCWCVCSSILVASRALLCALCSLPAGLGLAVPGRASGLRAPVAPAPSVCQSCAAPWPSPLQGWSVYPSRQHIEKERVERDRQYDRKWANERANKQKISKEKSGSVRHSSDIIQVVTEIRPMR